MFAKTLKFLDDLQKHNDKVWFEAHRERYERDVKGPSVAFVEMFAPRLAAMSPHLQAVATGRGSSISRIHRDTRFSSDKSPYKDWIGFHFTHGVRKGGPGLHLHVSRDRSGVGVGVWQLEPPDLKRVRDAIVDKRRGWGKVRERLDELGFESIGGEPLKNVPKGYPPDHPFAEDLKRKSCAAGRSIDVTIDPEELVDQVEAAFYDAWPLMKFLCATMDLPL